MNEEDHRVAKAYRGFFAKGRCGHLKMMASCLGLDGSCSYRPAPSAPSRHQKILVFWTAEFLNSDWSMSFPKRVFRDGIESGRMFRGVSVPACCIPQFEVVTDTDEHHFALQSSKLGESIGYQDSASTVDIDGLDLGVKKPLEHASLGVGRRSLIQLS